MGSSMWQYMHHAVQGGLACTLAGEYKTPNPISTVSTANTSTNALNLLSAIILPHLLSGF
jgi:hypothetical protein